MHFLFLQYIFANKLIAYSLIAIAIMFEGDVTLFSIAFFVHQHLIAVIPTIAVVLTSLFLGDMGWYLLGSYLVGKYSFIDRVINKTVGLFDKHLEKHPFKIIFISKFTYGIHHAVLVRCGQLHMNFKKYLKMILITDIVWFLTIGGLGYMFGEYFKIIRKYMRYAEGTLLIGVLIFFFFERVITKIIRTDLSEE